MYLSPPPPPLAYTTLLHTFTHQAPSTVNIAFMYPTSKDLTLQPLHL